MRCVAALLLSTLAAAPAALSQDQPAVPMDRMPVPGPDPVKFTLLPPDNQRVVVGSDQYAYSFCLGREVTLPRPGEGAAQPYLDPALSPCGTDQNPSSLVSGGNAPYHFEIDSGGFPPLGMILDLNGVLRGRPASDRQADFRVCAVDTRGWKDCHDVSVKPSPSGPRGQKKVQASQPHKGGSGGAVLLGGLALAGAAVAVGAAASMANQQTTESNDTKRCATGTDCGDGGCCNPGSGCCGVVGGVEKCCPSGFVHYCRATDKCYDRFPDCDFIICHGTVANAPGVLVGGSPYPTGLQSGNPRSKAIGVPPLPGCRAQ